VRALGAKKGIGIGLAIVLVAVTVGGWFYFRTSGDSKDPIVVGVTDRVDGLDPAASYTAGSWDLYSNIYQGLLTLSTATEEPVPDAAEHCEFTDNAHQVYRCTLRKGVTFSSGREMTPEDVKFSIERIQAMAARAAEEAADDSIPDEEKFVFRGPIGLVRGVEAIRTDGQAVIFELAEPEVTFPYSRAGGAGSIVDRHEYETDEPSDKAVGSGPYRLAEYRAIDDEAGTAGEAVLEPNPSYKGAYEPAGYPITIRYYPDPTALAEAWESREIHLNGGKMDAEDTVAIDRHDLSIRYSETTGMSIRVLVQGLADNSPTSDPVVRKAIAALIDRNSISRDVRKRTTEPALSLIPVGVNGHGTPYYDLYGQLTEDDVRDQLANAGYSFPIKTSTAFTGAVNRAEAEMVKEQLEADGLFELTIEEFNTAGEVLGAFAEGTIDTYLIGWRPDFSDPDTYTDALLSPGSILGHGHDNKDIVKLIAQTKAEGNRASTGELFREIHALAAEDAVVVPIWQDRNYTIAERDITGLQHLRDAGGKFRLWELSRI
jgi:peptide/nickel transport system substrate-binding protein